MISELHWTILEDANRQLALRLAKLRKARRSRRALRQAEMDCFQALQHLYASVQDAVAGKHVYKPNGGNNGGNK